MNCDLRDIPKATSHSSGLFFVETVQQFCFLSFESRINRPLITVFCFYFTMDVDIDCFVFMFFYGGIIPLLSVDVIAPSGYCRVFPKNILKLYQKLNKPWEGTLLANAFIFIFLLIADKRIRNLRSWSQEEHQQQDHLQCHLTLKLQRPKRSPWRRNQPLWGRRWRPTHPRR